MREVIANQREGFLLSSPTACKKGSAAGASAHAHKNLSGKRIGLRFPGANHVNRNALRLSQFADDIGRDHAGVVWAVGENHHDFSAGQVAGIFERQEQSIVERGIVSGHGIAHTA